MTSRTAERPQMRKYGGTAGLMRLINAPAAPERGSPLLVWGFPPRRDTSPAPPLLRA